jgi:hypothetical protein
MEIFFYITTIPEGSTLAANRHWPANARRNL